MTKIEDYIEEYLSVVEMTRATHAAYARSLRLFVESGAALDANCMTVFYGFMCKTKRAANGRPLARLKPATIAGAVSALKSWLGWLQANERIPEGLYSKAFLRYDALKSKRKPAARVMKMPAENLHKAIAYYDLLPMPKDPQECERLWRNRAIMWVLWDSAGRISECLSLMRADVSKGQRMIEIVGKGAKTRTLHLSDKSVSSIQAYLAARRDKSPALFVATRCGSTEHASLSRISAWKIVTDAAKACGLEGNISPHMIRHAKANQLTNEGMRVEALQEYLGHSSPSTTMTFYARIQPSTVAREVAEYSVDPREIK